MIRFLKNNDGVIPLVAALILLANFIFDTLQHGVIQNHHFFFKPESEIMCWVFQITALVLSYTALIAANRLFQQFALLPRISNLPLLISSIILSIIPSSFNHPSFWISALLMLGYLNSLFKFMNSDNPKQNAFWGGVLLSVAVWFFKPILFFGVLFFQAGFSSGMLNLRRLIIFIVGFIFPVYLILAAYFLFSGNFVFPDWLRLSFSDNQSQRLDTIKSLFVIFSYCTVVVTASTTLKSCTIREKRRFQLIVGMVLVSALIAFTDDLEVWMSISILPLGLIFARIFLHLENKWIREGMFLAFLIAALSFSL